MHASYTCQQPSSRCDRTRSRPDLRPHGPPRTCSSPLSRRPTAIVPRLYAGGRCVSASARRPCQEQPPNAEATPTRRARASAWATATPTASASATMGSPARAATKPSSRPTWPGSSSVWPCWFSSWSCWPRSSSTATVSWRASTRVSSKRRLAYRPRWRVRRRTRSSSATCGRPARIRWRSSNGGCRLCSPGCEYFSTWKTSKTSVRGPPCAGYTLRAGCDIHGL